MKWFILSVLTALTACSISCQNTSEGIEYNIHKAPVLAVKVKSATGTQVTFTAKASWPNGCGSFSHFNSDRSGDSIYKITIYGREPVGAACTQAFIEFDAPVSIDVLKSGRYTFQFWLSDSSTVDTTINVSR